LLRVALAIATMLLPPKCYLGSVFFLFTLSLYTTLLPTAALAIITPIKATQPHCPSLLRDILSVPASEPVLEKLVYDAAEMETLLNEYFPKVEAMARSFKYRYPRNTLEAEDLTNIGLLALARAKLDFDPAKSGDFDMYAKHMIDFAFMDEIRHLNNTGMSRTNLINLAIHNKIASLYVSQFGTNPTLEEIAFRHEKGRWPTARELAKGLNVDTASFETALKMVIRNFSDMESGSQDFNRSEDISGLMKFRFREDPNNLLLDNQLERQKADFFETLLIFTESTPDELHEFFTKQELFYLRGKFDEMSQDEIAEHLGVNQSRVSKIKYSALEKLQRLFSVKGLDFPDTLKIRNNSLDSN